MMRFTILALGSLALASAACGGRVIFEAPPGTGGAGTGTSGSGGSVSTVGVGAGTPGTSGVGASTSTTTTTTTTSTSVSSTSSSGGAPVQVFCNGAPCNDGEICCFNPMGPGDHCGNAGQCDPGYVVLSCNGPEDCPGGVCCATQDSQQNYTGVVCQATCTGPSEIVVCSKMQQDVCPAGTTCQHSQELGNGYRVCAP